MNTLLDFPLTRTDLKAAEAIVSLVPQEVYTLQGDRRGNQIVVLAGITWVTQTADLEDYTLHAGEVFTVTHPGEVVIQGMGKATARFALLV